MPKEKRKEFAEKLRKRCKSPMRLEKSLKTRRLFAIKCQKALAMCAKRLYNDGAIL
jgi:hypothetical protein